MEETTNMVEEGIIEEVEFTFKVEVLGISIKLIPSTAIPSLFNLCLKTGKILLEYQGTPVNII